jgi:hypothetical protein
MDEIFMKEFIQILKFFNVEFTEIEDLAARLRRRIGNHKSSLVFSDLFKLQNVLELYCREDWSDEDKYVAISVYLEYGNDEYRLSSIFAIPIKQDTHLKFRNLLSEVNIDQLKIQYQKAKYKDLVQANVRKMGLVKLERAILGSIAAFNSEEKRIAEIIMEEYLQAGKNKEFWHKDCDVILLEVYSKFKRLLSQNNYEPEDKVLFNMFHLLTLYFASIALQSRP